MKKIKNKFHLLVGSLLTTLLGFLGVSCGGQILLYGVPPYPNYVDIDGEVTNEDAQPLESMQVVISTSSYTERRDTLYTNASGKFERYCGLESNDTLLIEVNDTSDVYASEKVQIPVSEVTIESKNYWVNQCSVDVKLQLKKK